jgi:histidyl-tRNA synthetase
VTKIRQAGIAADLYPTPGKLNKQLKYASDTGCAFVGIAGDSEMKNGTLMVKNLVSGEQAEQTLEQVIAVMKGN